jgi:HTH-type transcriptional regulator, sugar sensing transcriptional regulator
MTAEEIFVQLGFNALESEVYISLLKNGAQTAYKIGKSLNKPTANVYKAVDVLFNAGAIEIEDGDIKICKAIAIESLASQLQQNYKTKLDLAVSELKTIKKSDDIKGIFKLDSVEAVLQRAKEMLERTEQIVVIDAFPKPLNLLKNHLDELSKNGREVFVEAYEPIKFEKEVSVAIPPISDKTLNHWKAQQLNIAVDGKEILVALFNDDLTKLIQATYSNNLYLSCIMYSGLMNEHKVIKLTNINSFEEFENYKNNQKFFYNSTVPGLDQLFKQYK